MATLYHILQIIRSQDEKLLEAEVLETKIQADANQQNEIVREVCNILYVLWESLVVHGFSWNTDYTVASVCVLVCALLAIVRYEVWINLYIYNTLVISGNIYCHKSRNLYKSNLCTVIMIHGSVNSTSKKLVHCTNVLLRKRRTVEISPSAAAISQLDSYYSFSCGVTSFPYSLALWCRYCFHRYSSTSH